MTNKEVFDYVVEGGYDIIRHNLASRYDSSTEMFHSVHCGYAKEVCEVALARFEERLPEDHRGISTFDGVMRYGDEVSIRYVVLVGYVPRLHFLPF